jgi:hypothetical protein
MQLVASALVVVVLFGLSAGPLRARMFRKLASRAVGDVYFSVSNRRAFALALARATGPRALSMTGAPCAVADTTGTAFWDNTPFEYVATIEWRSVESVDLGDIGSASTIVLSLDSGSRVPLMRPNGSNRFIAPRGEAAWLLSQLRLLHEASQT